MTDNNAKVIRPKVNNKYKYARIPIRRKTPETIMQDLITDDGNRWCHFLALRNWFNDFDFGKNIVMEIKEVSDAEYDKLLGEKLNG